MQTVMHAHLGLCAVAEASEGAHAGGGLLSDLAGDLGMKAAMLLLSMADGWGVSGLGLDCGGCVSCP